MEEGLVMYRQSEVLKYFEYGDGMIDKFCFLFQLLQIYVYHILIFKQQGQILQALEIMGRPTKDPKSVVPKRPKSLVLQYFGDNLDKEHAHCTLS